MKQHAIIAKVKDHGTYRTFKKVCRSKSGALKESRELNYSPLIRRFEVTDSYEFIPFSAIGRNKWGNLKSHHTYSDCSVSIHVEDMDGNNVNENAWGGCTDNNPEHLCETRDECNCDKVYPELEKRGFFEV